MSEVTELTNEQWELKLNLLCAEFVRSEGKAFTDEYKATRAELLRRLSTQGAGPSPAPQPRVYCPYCKRSDRVVTSTNPNWTNFCNWCGKYFSPSLPSEETRPKKRNKIIPKEVELVLCENCQQLVPPSPAGCIRCEHSLKIGVAAPSDTGRAELCGEVVQHLIAGASWFTCAMLKGHEGGHRAAGNCIKHGAYMGEPHAVPQCPKWPDCIKGAVLTGAAPSDTGREQPSDDIHIEFCESPCGHSSQYAYSEDGGKNIICLICERVAPAQAQPDSFEKFWASTNNSNYFSVRQITVETLKQVAKESWTAACASDPQKGQGWVSVEGCGCVCHKVGLFGLMCCPCTKQLLDEFVNGKAAPPSVPAGPQEEKK